MTPTEWMTAVGIGGTAAAGAIAWATHIAWTLSAMNSQLSSLLAELKDHKLNNATDHQELWRTVHELANVSNAHENRLVRLEATQTKSGS